MKSRLSVLREAAGLKGGEESMSRGAPGSSSGGARNVFLERITRLRETLRGVEERVGNVQDIVEDLVEAVGSEEALAAAFRPHMVSLQGLCDTHW